MFHSLSEKTTRLSVYDCIVFSDYFSGHIIIQRSQTIHAAI